MIAGKGIETVFILAALVIFVTILPQILLFLTVIAVICVGIGMAIVMLFF